MKISKYIASMRDELGNQFIIGLWFLFLAAGIATIFNLIAIISGEGSLINTAFTAMLAGFFLYIIIDMAKEKIRKMM